MKRLVYKTDGMPGSEEMDSWQCDEEEMERGNRRHCLQRSRRSRGWKLVRNRPAR